MKHPLLPRLPVLLVTLACAALSIHAAAQGSVNPASLVPDAVRKSGVLRVGTSPTYPPLEFKDPMTQKLQGLDIDLATEIAKRLGLQIEWAEQSFDQLINSLDTGRIDMGASGMTDIPVRREKIDFVDYFSTGTQLFTMADQAKGLSKAEDVCGKDVAVNRNGIFFVRLQDFNKNVCVARKLPEIKYSLTDKTADARLQILQGRVVAAAQGVDAIRYLNESPKSPDKGAFVLIGQPIAVDLAGFGFSKSNAALRDAVAHALTLMIADGSYARIFDAWALPYAKVQAVTINAQALPAATSKGTVAR
ncbi:ABC transporter substrate-binding protein [Variovorax sp. J31P207]|uniref:ABC transporter substrate-binding protein n=1 Tax=Variovorax sp. J31P207 TaxID=3053510 RepID=UPI00257653E1|nr:ABC transporter substrate-binding protein [Variovorax sp. J31P207]MDM0071611.1 ABC transporter substrate-binding protein [Variovorax sp. J31P207]